jgi:chaperonin GroES
MASKPKKKPPVIDRSKSVLSYCEPRDDRVVVKMDVSDDENVSKGGIIVVESRKTPPQLGTVVAVGPGARLGAERVPIELAPGDRVVVSKFAGATVESAASRQDDYIILREEDILARIPE